MWDPLSKKDARWYRLKADRDRKKKERLDAIAADMPRRLKIIAMVRAGELTLPEGQKMIRNGKNP